jgi:hypothetical protein
MNRCKGLPRSPALPALSALSATVGLAICLTLPAHAQSTVQLAQTETQNEAAVGGRNFPIGTLRGRLQVVDAPEIQARLDANTEEAAERGVFGSPTIFVGEEMYFGNDRMDFVIEELNRLEKAA